MLRYWLAVALALTSTAGGTPVTAQTITVDGLRLTVTAFDVADTRSVGGNDRGPALAVLDDGTLILGGGSRGGSVWTWSETNPQLRLAANIMNSSERIRDSRFAITDIAVLSQSATSAELLISYPRLNRGKCVEVVVHRATLNRVTNTLSKQERWFRSKPCVPISAVQHAAGRMEVINATAAYLTVGDLGYSGIDNRKQRGDLGSIFRISKSSVRKVSSGHRNPQGITLVNGSTLMASEHGPRGGDEINIIKQNRDYGWPFVTYGEPYSSGDYVIPRRTGTHAGYVEPITYWVPSIAPTELNQLPKTGYGQFSGGLVMGTLREEVLVFMSLDGTKITKKAQVSVGARIRDLDTLPDDRLIATTDDGRLLIVSA